MSRHSKVVLSIFLFYVGGLGIWFADAMLYGPLSLTALVPLAIMVMGTVSSIQSMGSSMRDVLASEAFFFGLSIFSRGVASIFVNEMAAFLFGMILLLAGPLLIVFASSLWSGFDYSNFRIRNVCYGVLAFSAAKVFLTVLFDFDYEGRIYILSDSLILLTALNIVILSTDRSISQSSLMQSIRESTESLASLMYTVDDAYILRSGCDEIEELMDSDSDGQVRLKLLSHEIRSRMLILTKTDGAIRADIFATGYVHANPLYMIDVRDIVIGEKYLTVYSDGGRWFRLLIHKNLQEDYSKAKIFGHVIDFDRMLRGYSYSKTLRRNIRDQEEERSPFDIRMDFWTRRGKQ